MSKESLPEPLLKPDIAKLDTSSSNTSQDNLRQEAVKALSSPPIEQQTAKPIGNDIYEVQKGKHFAIRVHQNRYTLSESSKDQLNKYAETWDMPAHYIKTKDDPQINFEFEPIQKIK
jgi:hypothetical protein